MYCGGEKKCTTLPWLPVALRCANTTKYGHFTHLSETGDSPDSLLFYFQHNMENRTMKIVENPVFGIGLLLCLAVMIIGLSLLPPVNGQGIGRLALFTEDSGGWNDTHIPAKSPQQVRPPLHAVSTSDEGNDDPFAPTAAPVQKRVPTRSAPKVQRVEGERLHIPFRVVPMHLEAGMSPPDPLVRQLEAIANTPAEEGGQGCLAHPAMLPFFKEEALEKDGRTIRYRLYSPEHPVPGKTYPLVVWLHGVGESTGDNVNSLAHLHHIIPMLAGPGKRDFYLLVTQCNPVETHWTNNSRPARDTFAVIDDLMANRPIDPNRVSIAGLSSGADGVWDFARRRPELFCAMVPLVFWSPWTVSDVESHPELKKIAVWAINSDEVSTRQIRPALKNLKKAGCNVYYTEFGTGGKHNAWKPAMLQANIFSWLIEQERDSIDVPPPGTVLVVK